jgi:hypothetical protein
MKCKIEKDESYFWKLHRTRDGLNTWCKECLNKIDTEEKMMRSFKRKRWDSILNRVVNGRNDGRNGRSYFENGIKIEISRDEFNEWCDENKDIIVRIFKNGDLPSVDRIDSDLGYTKNNMRVITFVENALDGLVKARLKKMRKVVGVNKETGDVVEFDNLRDGNSFGFNHSHIAACARGKRLSHKGYEWCYAN